ncbi:MAG: NUDIX hydrolase [Candidatus Pacebacteria bacterium]|nr:NUDIX hydrolase [Candidatus Paceibacterota bacterium]
MKISKDVQAVVYRKSDVGIFFLLLKRFDRDKGEFHYRLIKGGLERGENSKDAVIREIKEESGLRSLSLNNVLGHYSYKAGDVKHDVEVFLVENTVFEKIKTDSENEGGFTIESAEWLSPEHTLEYLNFDQEKKSIRKTLETI